MSTPESSAPDILAGRQFDENSFSIAEFNIAGAAEHIDQLVSPDPARPRYLRRDVPAGWYRLLALAVEAVCWRGAQEKDASIALIQCKEKFGELRLFFTVQGSDALKADIEIITSWARGQSSTVCAAYGTKAQITRDGWIIPLSENAIALRARDPAAFRQQTAAPDRPRGDLNM